MQFVLLSDQNAADFVDVSTVPLFEDPAPGQPTWTEMQLGAVKHDTFVFGRDGLRTLFWDARVRDLGQWRADIQAAVVALGM